MKRDGQAEQDRAPARRGGWRRALSDHAKIIVLTGRLFYPVTLENFSH
jgi:hypothetical protein